jgi:hypothetical protein
MEDLKHIIEHTNSDENLNVSGTVSGNYSMVTMECLYTILHEQYVTDRYQYGTTIVSASDKNEAMKKLNDYLSTNPDGGYTALPCKDINHIWKVRVLK